MVTRYAHLMRPGRLREGVERLVIAPPAPSEIAGATDAALAPPARSRLLSRKYSEEWCPRGESNTRRRV